MITKVSIPIKTENEDIDIDAPVDEEPEKNPNAADFKQEEVCYLGLINLFTVVWFADKCQPNDHSLIRHWWVWILYQQFQKSVVIRTVT